MSLLDFYVATNPAANLLEGDDLNLLATTGAADPIAFCAAVRAAGPEGALSAVGATAARNPDAGRSRTAGLSAAVARELARVGKSPMARQFSRDDSLAHSDAGRLSDRLSSETPSARLHAAMTRQLAREHKAPIDRPASLGGRVRRQGADEADGIIAHAIAISNAHRSLPASEQSASFTRATTRMLATLGLKPKSPRA